MKLCSVSIALLLTLSARAQQPAAYERPISWSRVLPNVAEDQKAIWTSPFRSHPKRTWFGVAAIAGATAGLLAVDTHEARYFRDSTQYGSFNRAFGSTATQVGILALPAALYAGGLFRQDSKMRNTALLAGEAVVGSVILSTILKDADRRLRPADVPPGGNFSDTWLDGRSKFPVTNASFPSGHAITAFAVATVVARRYGNHRWVPPLAYGLAGLVDFSRLTLSAHFASDVFIGSALGYSIARFAVLRQ